MNEARVTRWSDWLGLLAGLASLMLTLLIAVTLLVSVWFRVTEPGGRTGFHFYRDVYHLSSPWMLKQTLAALLPAPALAAFVGVSGRALARRAGPPAGHVSVAAAAERYSRVGLLVGGGISALVLASAATLVALRWGLWG